MAKFSAGTQSRFSLRAGDLISDALFRTAEVVEMLVENGAPEDLEAAEEALDSILACQEVREGAAHRGNFLWKADDSVIRDLNGVEFILKHILPIMIRHADRLTPAMRERLLAAIRLGLEEIRAMDVAITYTNVAAMDCSNSILGGELLSDEAIASRGHDKMRRFEAVMANNGTVFEFDSPTYTLVTLRALHQIAQMSRNEESRVRARTLAARLGLGAALHIHQTTGRWAGPHSRAYHESVVGLGEAEINVIRRLVEDGLVPAWVERVLDDRPVPMQVVETAHKEWNIGSTAYHAESFAMGTASREVSWQTDVFTIHYRIPDDPRPGIVYSRYLVDDKWFADDAKVRDRSTVRRLNEYGKFFGVQQGPRAIGIYAPRTIENFASFAPCSRDVFESAKAALIWSRGDRVDEIWAGGRRIDSLPADVAKGDVVVVASGDVLVAVRPLTRSDLGHGAPMRLVRVEDELLLEMYNYLGPSKGHNTLERRSRFYQGQPQCGFYIETAERSAYSDVKAFAEAVANGSLKDEAPPPFTAYLERANRSWTAEYSRDGQTLGIEVNLMEWELNRRWTAVGEVGWPMLESPVARQNADGRVEINGATLECGNAPAWLFADPERRLFVAGYHGEPAPLTLTTSEGQVQLDAMGTGTLVWDNGKVSVDALGVQGKPTVALS